MRPVTDDQGRKGFYDDSTGFIGIDEMRKVTNDKGERGYYHDSTGFIAAPAENKITPSTKPTIAQDNTPEWAGRNPNLYGLYGAGRALARTGIEGLYTTLGAAGGALIPLPGTTVAGGGVGYAVGKRVADQVLGDETDMSLSGIGKDVAVGAALQGAGSLVGKIPAIKGVISKATVSSTPAASKALDKASYAVMEKSMKVPPSNIIGGVKVNREKAINTALENKVPITKGGLDRVRNIIDDLGEQMDNVVAQNPNAKIKIDDVLAPVNDLKDFASKTVNGTTHAKKIDRVVNEFKAKYGDEITVSEAQEIKRNTNAFLKKSYGELKPVTEEATKQIVRGLKDQIAKEIPEIAGANLKYGEMKNLERVLERAVNRTGNWDWFSLSAGMAGSIVGGATGNVLKAGEAAGMWRLLKSPAVQSQIALSLKRMGKTRDANVLANTIADSIYNKMTRQE